MVEFVTFRRWVIAASAQEAEAVAVVRNAMVPAYQKRSGCRKLGRTGSSKCWRYTAM